MNIIQNIVVFITLTLASSLIVFGQTVSPALDVLSKYPKVRDFTMTLAGDEAYVTLQSPNEEISTIAVLRKKGGKWHKPQKAKFAGAYKDLEASLSPDGLTIYFVSNRPLNGTGDAKDFDIWFVKRTNLKSEWSKPENLGAPVNTEKDEFYPSVASNRNIYFTREPMGPKNAPDIMFSGWDGTKYIDPFVLSDAVNTDSHEYNSYIAPDESFLIFGGYQREDGLGSGDMYISFRNADNNWSKAKNMGPGVNSKRMDYCPFVDWKTKILYFTSRRTSVKPKEFGSLEAFENEALKYENGLSRIYQISISNLLKSNE